MGHWVTVNPLGVYFIFGRLGISKVGQRQSVEHMGDMIDKSRTIPDFSYFNMIPAGCSGLTESLGVRSVIWNPTDR